MSGEISQVLTKSEVDYVKSLVGEHIFVRNKELYDELYSLLDIYDDLQKLNLSGFEIRKN